jgi:F-type H+-transporting ATPase subunit delta
MSDKSARANRYAQAVFQAMLERWQTALAQVSDVLNQNQPLAAVLHDTSKSMADKSAALQAALPSDTPVEISNLLKLLIQEGDLELLPEIGMALAHVATGSIAPTQAEVTSAVALSPEEQEKLRSSLSAQYGEGLVFNFNVDPALMGGLRVRVGDRLIDTSIASRLSALRESLTAAVR